MSTSDFPAWYNASLYGGLACAVLSALVIAGWSLALRRGLANQVVGALLTCLIASALDAAPIVWAQNRLGVYGPTLAMGEVAAALAFTAICGWAAPLGAMIWYLLYATPLGASATAPLVAGGASTPDLMNPDRQRPAYPDGRPWAVLSPEPLGQSGGNVPLRHALVIVGRDPAADLTLADEQVSRFHAELRWGGGQAWLRDLRSLNGTRVNHMVVVGRAPVHDGDLVQFARLQYRFLAVANHPALAATPDQQPVETRKTSGVSGVFGAGGRPLALQWERDGEARRWLLSAPIMTIGREAGCAISIPEDSVSRLHGQITRQPSGYYIVDVESSNGIKHNGEPVGGPTRLEPGDTLQLGDVLLTILDATPSAGQDATVVSGPLEPPNATLGGDPAARKPAQTSPPPRQQSPEVVPDQGVQ